MRRYAQVSGTLFAFAALLQLTRALLGVPAQVGTVVIPIWPSFLVFLVTGALSIWAFRASARAG
jgi:hypothetical protein